MLSTSRFTTVIAALWHVVCTCVGYALRGYTDTAPQ
jgi:hypothetical protein